MAIVLRLCENLNKKKNLNLLIDNWLTSYSMLGKLISDGILACGTVRIDMIPQCKILITGITQKEEGYFEALVIKQ